jgi:hypothetical protein
MKTLKSLLFCLLTILCFTVGSSISAESGMGWFSKQYFKSMEYTEHLSSDFYLVREGDLLELMQKILSSDSYEQPNFKSLRSQSGQLYLVASIHNLGDRRAWGKGTLSFSYGRPIDLVFSDILANTKNIVSVVPLGMPALPLQKELPSFEWTWDELYTK